MNAQVETASGHAELEVKTCEVHTEGEFGGNLDVVVRMNPLDKAALLKNLRLRVPGSTELLDVIADGAGKAADEVEFTFHTPTLIEAEIPASVTVLWVAGGEKELGTIECTKAKEPDTEGVAAPQGAGCAGMLLFCAAISGIGMWMLGSL